MIRGILVVGALLLAVIGASADVKSVMEEQSKIDWKNATPAQRSQRVYHPSVLSVFPTFPGGEMAMYNFLAENVHAPVNGLEPPIPTYIVYNVSFIINADGTVCGVSVTPNDYADLNKEFEHTIASMPKWTPAYIGEKPVRTYCSFPLRCGTEPQGPDYQMSDKSYFQSKVDNASDSILYEYNEVDVPPMYKHGDYDMYKWINENLEWPNPEDDFQGIIRVEFIVEKDGSLSDFKLDKRRHPDFDAEALRLVKSLPGSWYPGRKDGKVVRTRYCVPVRMALE